MAFEEELAVAKRAARAAGEVMERYRSDGFSVERKSAYTDLVTEADEAVQERVVEEIRSEFPGDGFLGEENDLSPDGEDRVWVIDPIDGTTNFVHGFPYYCTSIGLRVEGEEQVGVVYAPRQDELFAARRGGGATLDGDPIETSGVTELADALVVGRLTNWGNNPRRVKRAEAAFLDDLVDRPSSFRRPGAAALDLANIAAGRLDATAQVTICDWDVAAGRVLLEEAGGAVRLRDAIVDGYLELVATNGPLQDELERVFDRNVHA